MESSTDFVRENEKSRVGKHTAGNEWWSILRETQVPSLLQAELAVFLRSAPLDVIRSVLNILLKYISVSFTKI